MRLRRKFQRLSARRGSPNPRAAALRPRRQRIGRAGFFQVIQDFGRLQHCLAAPLQYTSRSLSAPFGPDSHSTPEVTMAIERTLSIIKPDGVGA